MRTRPGELKISLENKGRALEDQPRQIELAAMMRAVAGLDRPDRQ